MKTSILAIAASALLVSVDARLNRRNAHANAHAHFDIVERSESVCPPKPCTTYVTGTWVDYKPPHTSAPYSSTKTVQSTLVVTPVEHKPVAPTTTSCVTVPYTPTHPVPTPQVTTCPTPGTYTIPAKTVTVTSSETVCVPTTTVCPTPGVYTVGSTVTVVTCSTTVTCPYATIVTKSNTAYTTITSTTLVCPSAGTYTYGGIPTTVATPSATCTYPVVAVYTPATYIQSATTVTVVSTSYAVTCPYATYSTPAPKPTTPVVVYSSVPAPVYSAPAPVYSAPAPVYSSVSSSAQPAKTSPAKSTNYDNISGVGNQWCITYSPYNDDTSCRSAEMIQSDIADIASKGFHSIRLYSADCGALDVVGSACELHGLKIVLGVFIKAGGVSTASKDLDDIITWGKWSLVEMMVIGNEAIFNGWVTATDLASFILECKAKLSAAGCNAPITTSETLNILQSNPGLCNVIDVVGVNIHPYFNAGVTSGQAGEFLLGQLKLAESVCGKTAYCLEAGWPSAGSANGVAVPGVSEQHEALSSIYAIDMGRITYFTYTNDGWKQPGAFGVEQNFGCVNSFPMSSY